MCNPYMGLLYFWVMPLWITKALCINVFKQYKMVPLD